MWRDGQVPPFSSRPLNRLEANLLHLERVTGFSFVVLARGTGPLDRDLLGRALAHVGARHYYLNVVVGPGDPPTFVVARDRAIPVMEPAGGGPVREAERQLNTRFDMERGPLARVVLASDGDGWDLVVAFQHLASDGVSGVHFTRDLVEACGRLLEGRDLEPAPVRDPVFPSVEALPDGVWGPLGALRLAGFLGRMGLDAVRSRGHLPGTPWVPFDQRDVRLAHRAFGPEETAALVSACRGAGTTVQGALAAALLLTLGRELREREHLPTPVIRCVSSVDARPHCRVQVPSDEMGLWVGQALQALKVGPRASFWDLARAVTRHLKATLASGAMFAPYRLLFRRVHPDGPSFVRQFENAVPYVEVTNVGQLGFGTRYGPLRLEKLHFASGLQFTQGTRWGLTVATATFDGCLLANVHTLARWWSRDQTEAAADGVVEEIRGAVRPGVSRPGAPTGR